MKLYRYGDRLVKIDSAGKVLLGMPKSGRGGLAPAPKLVREYLQALGVSGGRGSRKQAALLAKRIASEYGRSFAPDSTEEDG